MTFKVIPQPLLSMFGGPNDNNNHKEVGTIPPLVRRRVITEHSAHIFYIFIFLSLTSHPPVCPVLYFCLHSSFMHTLFLQKDARGSVSLKIVPSHRNNPAHCEVGVIFGLYHASSVVLMSLCLGGGGQMLSLPQQARPSVLPKAGLILILREYFGQI